ncbi:MAG TPA: bifunctional phosphopantothenoylcysteine decarboxylase/phosphopantothenate--cysteine ligase CoaBC [Actinomycetota bacterium]|nr:bifunctional phosphopantothenoylcysteine decarboxylase/phosphopantothenate--cysteine ligase CoaBC [Actinomycetota bacterium]
MGASDLSQAAQGKKVLVCVTGGIAAYKVPFVVRALAELGTDVRVVMTRSAARFVGEQTFAALSGNDVYTELFGVQGGRGGSVPHVELARSADLVVVAPATANSLAKMALGLADDLFGNVMLTVRCPVLVAPAMHTEMWEHQATQEHMTTLRARGVHVVGPESGALSSGDTGPGRMAEPDAIVADALRLLERVGELDGYRLLVTAGGTQEPLDPVRFIGNRSSGLMGYLIAEEAQRRGAKVTLVSGPSNLAGPAGVDVVRVKTAQEMRDAVFAAAPEVDVIVKAAAVADFMPASHADHKLKKSAGPPEVTLVPTPDILAELGATPEARKPGGILVGFAAETEPDPSALSGLALKKLESKKADLIVANDVGSGDSGFDVPTNRAVLASRDGVVDVGLVTKEALATALIDHIAHLLSRSSH